MPMNATPATTPPTMGPVFELLPRGGGAVGGDAVDMGFNVIVVKIVAGRAWVVVPAGN